uniref:Uncharacterized protein n=1 Tax=Medicago truncatula TaxID=3880 RepID=A2Q1D7_MEDTR|nr:hypothetical protein MtrDRAFT_AC148775g12v2 [Medicago truncatula]
MVSWSLLTVHRNPAIAMNCSLCGVHITTEDEAQAQKHNENVRMQKRNVDSPIQKLQMCFYYKHASKRKTVYAKHAFPKNNFSKI